MSEPQYPSNPDASAFPWNSCTEEGLNKREYIATQAMVGLLASKGLNGAYSTLQAVADAAVKSADALIASLNK